MLRKNYTNSYHKFQCLFDGGRYKPSSSDDDDDDDDNIPNGQLNDLRAAAISVTSKCALRGH